MRAKVEHSIGVIKRVFGFTKVRYRGLDKNAHRLFVTCALANLFIVAASAAARLTKAESVRSLDRPGCDYLKRPHSRPERHQQRQSAICTRPIVPYRVPQ